MAFLSKSFFSLLLIFSMLAVSTEVAAKEKNNHKDSIVGAYTAVDEFSNYNIAINKGGTLVFSTTSSLETFDGIGVTKGTTWTGCWKNTRKKNTIKLVATNTVAYVNCEEVCGGLEPGYRQKAEGKIKFNSKTGEVFGTVTVTVYAWSDLSLENPLGPSRIANIRAQKICGP